MRLFKNILLALTMVLVVSSCDEMFDLDLQENPNAVLPEQASIEDLYNNIQLTFNNFIFGPYSSINFTAGALSRMYQSTAGLTYQTTVGNGTANGIYNAIYSGLIPDVDALNVLAEERGLDIHAGSGKIMKAMALVALVDFVGEAPLSEIGQGTDLLSPKLDDGASIYAEANRLLDEAIAQLSGTEATAPSNDIFYGGDAAKWVTLANTLKLRNALTLRQVDPGSATSTINGLIGGDIIDEASEDFAFTYGVEQFNPNSRHPWYNNSYNNNDGTYQNNWYMWMMYTDKNTDTTELVDPRMRFYFNRQVGTVIGRPSEEFSCIFREAAPTEDNAGRPDHYTADGNPNLTIDMPFCAAVPARGYYGRDHLNGTGIPPDGPTRTVWGLYPAGGKFDDNSYGDIQNNGVDGAQGQGINPIMLSSYVYFMRAEAALMLGTNDDAAAMLEAGVRASFDKVVSFADKVDLSNVVGQTVDGEDITAEQAFVPSAERVDEYVNIVLTRFNAASKLADKMDILAKEYLIALWGSGLEAYNFYRRTGLPYNLQPAIEPAAGEFIKSMFYPSLMVQRNLTVTQKATLTEPVFWDKGETLHTIY